MEEVALIASVVEQQNVQRVGLQFPDDLLGAAWGVVSQLREVSGAETFVLGDSSYGDCCVDEVAAEHADVQLVVHFGHACLSRTRHTPVLYIPPAAPAFVDQAALKAAVAQLKDAGEDTTVVVVPELCYVPQLKHLEGITIAQPVVPLHTFVPPNAERPEARFANYHYEGEGGRPVFLWVGSASSRTLRGTLLGLEEDQLAVFDPAGGTQSIDAASARRLLRQRFAFVEKVRNAHRIGVVAGTLSVAGQLWAIDLCRSTIERSGRRCYVLCVGKPSPVKLGNFAELDAFVLVACPENSLLDGREYLRPIVTPLELVVALKDEYLDPKTYSTDFVSAIDAGLCDCNEVSMQWLSAAATSFIGTERHVPQDSSAEPAAAHPAEKSTSLSVRGDWSVLDIRGEGSAAQFMKTRAWQGLEYKTSSERPTKASEGKSGTASGYQGEPSDSLSW